MRTLTAGDTYTAAALELYLGDPVGSPPGTRSVTETVRTCEERDGVWDVSTEQGSGFSITLHQVPWPKRQHPPQPGDDVTIYTYHGSDLVGFDLRGERLYLHSEREMNLRWLTFRAKMAREGR